MEREIETLSLLVEQGKQFTYENFSLKSRNGYPESLSPEWAAWITRCDSITTKLFGKESAQDRAMRAAHSVPVIGNGSDKFEQCRNYILGALDVAIETLKEDVFGELQKNRLRGLA